MLENSERKHQLESTIKDLPSTQAAPPSCVQRSRYLDDLSLGSADMATKQRPNKYAGTLLHSLLSKTTTLLSKSWKRNGPPSLAMLNCWRVISSFCCFKTHFLVDYLRIGKNINVWVEKRVKNNGFLDIRGIKYIWILQTL